MITQLDSQVLRARVMRQRCYVTTITTAIFSLLFSVPCASQPVGCLTNGDFDQGMTGWTPVVDGDPLFFGISASFGSLMATISGPQGHISNSPLGNCPIAGAAYATQIIECNGPFTVLFNVSMGCVQAYPPDPSQCRGRALIRVDSNIYDRPILGSGWETIAIPVTGPGTHTLKLGIVVDDPDACPGGFQSATFDSVRICRGSLDPEAVDLYLCDVVLTQSIQNNHSSSPQCPELSEHTVPLVTQRTTVARAFVNQGSGRLDGPWDGVLRVHWNGVMSREVRSNNGPLNNSVMDPSSDTGSLDFLFKLNDEEATQLDSIVVEINPCAVSGSLYNGFRSISESNFSNNRWKRTPLFVTVDPLRIVGVALDMPSYPRLDLLSGPAGPREGIALYKRAFPLPHPNYVPLWRIASSATTDGLHNRLQKTLVSINDLIGPFDWIHGWLPPEFRSIDSQGNVLLGNASPSQRTSWGGEGPVGNWSQTFAHELGHAYGNGERNEPGVIGNYGYDVYARHSPFPGCADCPFTRTIDSIEIMRQAQSSIDRMWAGVPTVTTIISHASSEAQSQVANGTPGILVTGTLNQDSATISSPFPMTAGNADPISTSGSHRLLGFNASNERVLFTRFDAFPIFGGTDSTELGFSVRISQDVEPSLARLVVRDISGVDLGTLIRTAYPPVVIINEPISESVLRDTLRVNWSATDVDGDVLTSSLLYSWDGGTSWIPITIDEENDQVVISTSELPGTSGSTGILRLIVSDGFNRTTVEMQHLDVGYRHSPVVAVEAESLLVSEGSTALLSAFVHDLEEAIIDSAITWTDANKQIVGRGREVLINASGVGHQIFEVTYIDCDGMSSSDVLSMIVQPRFRPAAKDVSTFTFCNSSALITLEGTCQATYPLEFIITSLPQHGSLKLPGGQIIDNTPWTIENHGGTVLYVPHDGWSGTEQFAFTVTNGRESGPGSVTIIVGRCSGHPNGPSIDLTTFGANRQNRYLGSLGKAFGETVKRNVSDSTGIYDFSSAGGNQGPWWVAFNGSCGVVESGEAAPNTYGGKGPDFFGYKFKVPVRLDSLKWCNNKYYDGGTFSTTPIVEVLKNGAWSEVLCVWSPTYDATYTAGEVDSYTIELTPEVDSVQGVRLYGLPAGTADGDGFVGNAEFTAYGAPQLWTTLDWESDLTDLPGVIPVMAGLDAPEHVIDNDLETFDTTFLAPEGSEDFVGVLWPTEQHRISAIGVVLKWFSDGGWFDQTVSEFVIETTSDYGSSWVAVAEVDKDVYNNDYNSLASLAWDVESGFLFTFDPVHSANGIRIRGDGAGTAGDGFIAVTELEVFGSAHISGAPESSTVGRTELMVKGPFPNPFATETHVDVTVGEGGHLDVTVLDVAGRRIRSIEMHNAERGQYRVSWDGVTDRGENAPSGVYFLRVQKGREHVIKRVLRIAGW